MYLFCLTLDECSSTFHFCGISYLHVFDQDISRLQREDGGVGLITSISLVIRASFSTSCMERREPFALGFHIRIRVGLVSLHSYPPQSTWADRGGLKCSHTSHLRASATRPAKSLEELDEREV